MMLGFGLDSMLVLQKLCETSVFLYLVGFHKTSETTARLRNRHAFLLRFASRDWHLIVLFVREGTGSAGNEMDVQERLKEKFGSVDPQARIGGKGSARRKKKVLHRSAATDDKKLQSSLKKLGVNTIPGIEEVSFIKDDGQVLQQLHWLRAADVLNVSVFDYVGDTLHQPEGSGLAEREHFLDNWSFGDEM